MIVKCELYFELLHSDRRNISLEGYLNSHLRENNLVSVYLEYKEIEKLIIFFADTIKSHKSIQFYKTEIIFRDQGKRMLLYYDRIEYEGKLVEVWRYSLSSQQLVWELTQND
jgi:hypothetical protein